MRRRPNPERFPTQSVRIGLSALRSWMLPVIAAGFWMPSSSLAAGLTSAELSQRSQEIVSMTAAERDRLQRNWRTFQSLSDERKQHFRQLHEQLETDMKTGGSQLNHVMQTYAAWLQTLTPGQRADLRQAKTPKEKLELVRKIKADQDLRQESRALNEPSPPHEFAPNRWRFWQRIALPLTTAELNAVIDALAQLLPNSEREAVEHLDKWRRYQRVIQASATQADGPKNWPDREQQAAMLAAMGKSERAERFKGIREDEARRRRFVAVIFSSLAAEMLADSAPFQPKSEDRERIFAELDNTSREEVMRLPAEKVPLELGRRFYRQQYENSAEFREFVDRQREFQMFFMRFWVEADVGGRFGIPGRGELGRFPPPGGRDGSPPEREFRDRPQSPRRRGEERN
jgi:hypothetical protein